jgi:hypothetical protein
MSDTANTKYVNTCKLTKSQHTPTPMHQDHWIASIFDRWTMPKGGTNYYIYRPTKLSKIPVTPSIVKQVHALAELEEMPKGLKITNRANQVIFNSAWIAEVDYDEELFDDDIDDDYDEEENGEENENQNENDDQYDEMDENDMADILQQPNDVPQETENEHEIVFEEANDAEELQEEEGSSDDDEE